MIADKLIDKIIKLKNPTAVGLDTSFDYLPEDMQKSAGKSLSGIAKAVTEFNLNIIENIYKTVPCVKIQVAYYEMYGVAGMQAFKDTIDAAKNKGLIVISDVKRNDIGSTAECYSKAYLRAGAPFESDYITVNGYLGEDGIRPFLEDSKKYGKGIFVLVKTSNISSSQLQNRVFTNGATLYETMGGYVKEWGEGMVGTYGFSSVGAVVGATHPKEAESLRSKMPQTFFLIPGYGAQGGTADDLTVCFNEKGLGGIVNNSRGILCAYKNEKYKGQSYFTAAKNAAEDMQKDILGAFKRKDISF